MRRTLLFVVVVLAACLGPRQDPSAFFMLSPAPAGSEGTPVPVILGVGPVTIPAYLDRPQMVVRLSDNEIALAEADRWAEPLGDNITRTLEENLSALLPGSSSIDYPWYESEAPDYALAFDVRRFEADSTGGVVLDVVWRIDQGDRLVDGRRTRIEESATGVGRSATVAAQSQALARLSVEVAGAVRAAWRSR